MHSIGKDTKMKIYSEKSQLDYLKDINLQLKKTIPEQLEDLKVAVAQLCVALDKLSQEIDK